jgi:hypothetical protein
MTFWNFYATHTKHLLVHFVFGIWLVMTSLLIMFPCHFPIAAGVALDVIGRWVAQLFHHPTLLPLESRKWDNSCLHIISRVSPVAFGNWVGQHIQPVRNSGKVKNRFWLVREFCKLAIVNYKPSSVNTSHIPKEGDSVSVLCAPHKNVTKAHWKLKGE